MWTHGGEHSQEANNKAWGESLLEVFKEGKESEAGVAVGGVSTEVEEVRSESQRGPDSGGPFKDFGFYSELD